MEHIRVADYMWRLGSFLRLPLFGWSLAMPVLGVLTVSGHANLRTIVAVLMSIPFHIVFGVLNDLASVELDRQDPRKARRPLVTGAVTPTTAKALVAIAVVVAFPADVFLLGLDAARSVALAIAFTATAAYNVVGKRTRVPPLMDMLLGAGSAAFVHYGALAVDTPLTATTFMVELAVIIYIVLDNGVHFGVRDLRSDLESGAWTTPILFGARPQAGAPHLPRVFLAYALSLQAILTVTTLVPLLVGRYNYQTDWSVELVAAVFAVGTYVFIYPSIDAARSASGRYVSAGVQSLCAFGSIAALASAKHSGLYTVGLLAVVAVPLGAKRVTSTVRRTIVALRSN